MVEVRAPRLLPAPRRGPSAGQAMATRAQIPLELGRRLPPPQEELVEVVAMVETMVPHLPVPPPIPGLDRAKAETEAGTEAIIAMIERTAKSFPPAGDG